jgi:hypothetical protein
MTRFVSLTLLLLAAPLAPAAELPKPLVAGMTNPESVVVAPDGRVFVSVIGGFDTDGDGAVVVVKDGKAAPFVLGLDDPKGLALFQNWLYVTDKTKLLRINLAAKEPKADVVVAADKFPAKPQYLNDVVVDPRAGPRTSATPATARAAAAWCSASRPRPLRRVRATNSRRARRRSRCWWTRPS